jgi:arylsulfatase
MGRLTENCVLNVKNKSYAITAEIVVPDAGASGVIVSQGGLPGGWSLYANEGKLKYCYNLLGVKMSFVESEAAVPAGQHQVRMEFKYDGGGLAKGGEVTLYIDGKSVGQGRVDVTEPMAFSADETLDVGKDTGSAVSPDYGVKGNDFNGDVNWVQIDLEDDNHDHLITADERFKVAMARQ